MSTKTPRERFDEKFHRIVEDECILSKSRDEDGNFEKSDLSDVWEMVETLLEEAGLEMKEKLAAYIKENRNTVTLVQIEDFISSFK